MQNLQFEELDSYILKHRINYNTTFDSTYTEPQKMMFIDYDLARKSQPSNASNFGDVLFTTPISQLASIEMNYYDDTYTIFIDGEGRYTDQFNSTNVIDNVQDNTQEFYNGNISEFNVNDDVEVNIYQYYNTSGHTSWTHNGLSGEVWYVSGYTENNTQWELTGITNADGYTSGYGVWNVYEKIPILTYTSKVINISGNSLILNRELKKHIYNNFLATPNLYYDLITLNHADSYDYNIYKKILKSPYGEYLSVNIDDPIYSFIFTPIRNPNDIYFDYDVFNISMNTTVPTTNYFHTDCVYNKYNLDEFFDQLSIPSSTDVLVDSIVACTPLTYTGQTLTMVFPNEDVIEIFHEYLYVNVFTSSGNYISLITNKYENTITIEVPIGLGYNDVINSISNIPSIGEISDILQKCYINKDDGYYIRREKATLDKMYYAYSNVFNLGSLNNSLRQSLTGMIFENGNSRMTLKIYNPSEAIDFDSRLTYIPFEITRIGKDRKTTIPVQINDISQTFLFNILDGSSTETDIEVDGNVDDDLVIDSNAD